MLIYFLMFIITGILNSIFYTPYGSNSDAGVILICNTICFLVLSKIFKVNKNTITKLLVIILLLFAILITDKDMFYSNYVQCTPDPLTFPILSCILYFVLLPFTVIFNVLYNLNLFDLSFVFIPAYFIIVIFINRLILSLGKKDFKINN